jgi:single-strand DNA-binding protein
MPGSEPAGRVAIETTTKEDTEMARTRKTAETAGEDKVVQLPQVEDQSPADDQDQDQAQDAVDEPTGAEDEAPESQPRRSAGPGLNRVELIGRIAKDPDVRITPSGMHVAYFRLATNGFGPTEFHQCTAFGKTAEFLAEYLRTGRLVFIEGRLQTRTYDDQHGIRRWVTTIVVNRLQVLDQRRRDEQ